MVRLFRLISHSWNVSGTGDGTDQSFSSCSRHHHSRQRAHQVHRQSLAHPQSHRRKRIRRLPRRRVARRRVNLLHHHPGLLRWRSRHVRQPRGSSSLMMVLMTQTTNFCRLRIRNRDGDRTPFHGVVCCAANRQYWHLFLYMSQSMKRTSDSRCEDPFSIFSQIAVGLHKQQMAGDPHERL